MSIGIFLTKATACIKVAGDLQLRPGGADLPEDQQPVITDLGNGLIVAYLVDEGEHLSYVQHHHLAAIKGQPKALHEIGLINLSVRAQANLRVVEQGLVHGLLLDGLFEASLVLLDDLWDGPLAQYVPNGAVVVLPARDVLAFCDANSPQGVAELRQLAARTFSAGNHTLTATPYRRQDGAWHPLP